MKQPSEHNVVGVRIVHAGKTRRADPDQAPTPRLTLSEASARWAHLQEELKAQPWSAVPGDMLRDFLIAGADTLREAYGSNAPAKAAEVLVVSLGERGLTEAGIKAAWFAASAGMGLELTTRQLDPDAPIAQPGTEFTVDGPAGADEAQVLEGLGKWANREHPVDRLVLDPFLQVPSEDLRDLVRQVEALLGDPSDQDNQFDTLMASAAILILWEQMEQRNAATSDFSLSGLTNGDRDILPGLEVLLHGTRIPLDSTPSQDADSDTPRQVSRVRLPRNG